MKLSAVSSSNRPVESTTVLMALINARSVVNKTFILNDYYVTYGLDFLLITETWLNDADSSPLAELLPRGCSYLSTSRSNRRGGGLAVIFNNMMKCELLPVESSKSFEVQLMKIDLPSPVICALIYRPPGYNKNFLDEFCEFLSVVVPPADRILIMGDFNIHVCCPGKPMTKEFLNLFDSFNLFQCVSGPTHDHGHTLDLVFSLGITIENICVEEMAISDHMPIRFNFTSTTNDCHQPPSFLSRVITTSTPSAFSTAFTELALHIEPTILSVVGPDELVDSFNHVCSEILDNVAPFKMRCQKVKKRPWLNDVTRNLRRVCRLEERKWLKDKLQISYDILRESLSNYQNAVRAARSSYFS